MCRTIAGLSALAVVAVLLAAGMSFTQDKQAEKKGSMGMSGGPPEKGGGPATCKVEKGPLQIEVSLKGVLTAEQMTEVFVKPEAWAMPLVVHKAVPHGTAVKKGTVLLSLDVDKIDQAIRDLKAERALSELAIKQAEEELPVLEKSTPLELAAAERLKKQADEDLKKFLDVDRPLAEESAQQSVKSATHYLEYAKEELKQLEKMYRSKDLTEETEEIILKRQRHQVESSEFYLKSALIRRDQVLKVDLPRQELAAREKAAKETLSLDKARNGLPLALNQKKLALQKLKYENAKNVERLAKLEKDREGMIVHAPADGIVYYGKCQHGQWTTAAMVTPKLQPGGIVMPDEVLLTVVTPRPFYVEATVEEKDLYRLKPDLKGKAVLTGFPDVKLPATVKGVSAVPLTPGSFAARVAVEPGQGAEALMPGMACAVKLVVYRKDDALTVPATAVFQDDDGDEHYVYLTVKRGKPEKRVVQVGQTANGKTEIVQGLRAGDTILAAKPAQE